MFLEVCILKSDTNRMKNVFSSSRDMKVAIFTTWWQSLEPHVRHETFSQHEAGPGVGKADSTTLLSSENVKYKSNT